MWLHIPQSAVGAISQSAPDPSITSPSAPAAAASTPDSDWLYQQLVSSLRWRTKPLPLASWRRVCRTVPWMTQLSGAILEPSRASRGAEAWIASLQDSHVRTSARPGSDEDSSREIDPDSGLKYIASFARWDQSLFSWKTSNLSLFEDSTSYSGAWPRFGTMRSGVCFRLPVPRPRTSVSDFSSSRIEDILELESLSRSMGISNPLMLASPTNSMDRASSLSASGETTTRGSSHPLWPTPAASVANDGESPETWRARAAILQAKHGNGNGAGTPLTVAAMEAIGSTKWPTPRVSAERSSRGSMVREGHWSAPALEQAAELAAGQLPREYQNEDELTPQARRMFLAGQQRQTTWPTPDTVNRKSRRALMGPKFGDSNRVHFTAPGLEQAAELASGHLPREFQDETELTPQARRMWESSQNWPTPTRRDGDASARHTTTTGRMHSGTTLTDAIRTFQASRTSLWPTPDAPTGGGGGLRKGANIETQMTEDGKKVQIRLQHQAEAWRPQSRWLTPSATEPGGTSDMVDSEGKPPSHFNQRVYSKSTGRLVEKGIAIQALAWPTPQASVEGGQATGPRRQVMLQNLARGWPTPRAEDAESAGNHPNAQDSLTGVTKGWQGTPAAAPPPAPTQTKSRKRKAPPKEQLSMFGSDSEIDQDLPTPPEPERTPRHTADSPPPNQWPTPQWADGDRGTMYQMRGNPTLFGAALSSQPRCWPSVDTLGSAPSQATTIFSTRSPLQHRRSLPTASTSDDSQPVLRYWPTPASRDYRSPNSADSQERRNEGSSRGQQLPNFVAHLWPTPVAQEDQKSPAAHLAMKSRMKGGERTQITSLNVLTKVWPTPDVSSGRRNMSRVDPEAQRRAETHRTVGLPTVASDWSRPSPEGPESRSLSPSVVVHSSDLTQTDERRSLASKPASGLGWTNTSSPTLWAASTVQATGPNSWPTLPASGAILNPSWDSPAIRRLQMTSAPGQPSLSDTQASSRRLSPKFVSWLMGWPAGWCDVYRVHESTSFVSWEMVSSLLLRRLQSAYLPIDCSTCNGGRS